MTFRRSLAHVLCAAALLSVCAGVAAQDYPVKPLRFIAPNLPGGPTDILARLLGQKLSGESRPAGDRRESRRRGRKHRDGSRSQSGA